MAILETAIGEIRRMEELLLARLVMNLKEEIPPYMRRELLPKDVAHAQLKQMTGQDFGDDIGKWEEWIRGQEATGVEFHISKAAEGETGNPLTSSTCVLSKGEAMTRAVASRGEVTPMRFVMNVADIRRVPSHGVALGGVNPAYDPLTEEQIRSEIGDKVAVETVAGKLREYNVLGVTTSSSLVGGKNVFVLLPEEADESELGIGSQVLALLL